MTDPGPKTLTASMTMMDSIIRRSEERGSANFGWLDSRHSFSFGGYYDPRHMGFGPLRVINEDRVAPGGGFPTHPHRDMEIITYVIEGGLAHRDSTGTSSVIRPGDVQRMSAGTGVRHSEYNASETDPVRFLQIWIIPDEDGLKPDYEQKTFAEAEKRGKLRLVGSSDGRDGSVTIHQNVDLYAMLLEPGESVSHRMSAGRVAWVQVVDGGLIVNGQRLRAGDGLAMSGADELRLKAQAATEALVFDMTP